MNKTILSPKTEVRDVSLNGKGTFAIEDIKKDEVIFIRGGELMKMEEAYGYEPGKCPDGIWPITDEYWLGARNKEDYELQKVYVNHSCDPNCGMRGEITCVAMRDIKAGEEITQDYGMLDDSNYVLDCTCGSPNCRGIITGKDWRLRELWDKYDYFAEYLKAKIMAERG